MKNLTAMFILMTLFGCNVQSEVNAINSMRDTNKIWVFAQFNVQEENDGLESYYYYAQISKKLYDHISYNEIDAGFILLENVRYWGGDDLIYDYKDIEFSGEIIMRVENIARLSLVNKEPIAGKGAEQFEDAVVEGSGVVEQQAEM